MNEIDQTTELPADISFRALLGLAEPVGMDGDFVRSIQARSCKRPRFHAGLRSTCFFAVVALALYRDIAPPFAMISWTALFAGFHLFSFHKFASIYTATRTRYDKADPAAISAFMRSSPVLCGARLS